MNKNTQIVVIGNGIAGVTACKTIREINPSVPVILISDENTPAYSAPVLAYYLGGDVPRSRLFIRKTEDYQRAGLKTLFGEKVDSIDCKARKVFFDSKSLDFDMLVLATGSRPQVPAVRGVRLRGVFTFKTLADIDAIVAHQPKRAVVAGAGPVGVEAAVALRKMGAEVTLVATRWVTPRAFDEKAAHLIQKEMEKNGVKVINWERVQAIEGKNKVESVTTEKRSLECDTVIMAAGMAPDVELARKAGIKIGDLGGIVVDDAMRTSVEGVYACGDCVEALDALTGKQGLNLLWSNARQQGRVAGANCLGKAEKFSGSINVRALNVFDISASSFGYNAASLRGKKIEIIEKETRWGYYGLIFHEGKLAGGQWVGHIKDTGSLMAKMRRDYPSAGVPRQEKPSVINPMWANISQYLPMR